MPTPVGDAYAGCRRRLTELVRPLSDEQAEMPVPACPLWRVHDVISHVAGVVDDALAGRLEGVATDPWTEAQVEARRDTPVGEILDEWDAAAPAFEALLDPIGPPGRQAVLDLATHEHDVRGALRAAGARDADAVAIGAAFIVPILVASAAERGIALRVEVAGDGDAAGAAAAAAGSEAGLVLRGTAWELMRAITGRRSADQLRELEWEGFDEAVLAAFEFGPFRPAAVALVE